MSKIVKNIFPSNVNKEIIRLLKSTEGWYFGYDEKQISFSIAEDEGLALRTFPEQKNNQHNFQTLNMFAYNVASIVCDKLKITLKGLKRVNYNFYHSLSKGNTHIDSETDKCVSILYNLNTNDGYTQVEENKFNSNESEAIVFNSNTKHKGVGPTKGLRYNINIIIYT
tara:strand:+ start:86 stop:589 length:504 start_codon:yes stop_codon:yes gene_type:complete